MERAAMASSIIACLLLASACSTVTVNPRGAQKRSSSPTYSERHHYGFWGLTGEKWIDVKDVCDGAKPVQMQAQTSFLDGLFGGITIGLYAPRHARVWCE